MNSLVENCTHILSEADRQMQRVGCKVRRLSHSCEIATEKSDTFSVWPHCCIRDACHLRSCQYLAGARMYTVNLPLFALAPVLVAQNERLHHHVSVPFVFSRAKVDIFGTRVLSQPPHRTERNCTFYHRERPKSALLCYLFLQLPQPLRFRSACAKAKVKARQIR
jgi:hypothetical protein